MALTVTSRGSGTHNTGATTLVPGGRTATLAAGSMGVLCIALDNAGSGGASLIAPDSWTDAKGNVWTLRQNALYDNGAASAGIEMAIYTAPITVALLTTDAGTMTWKAGAAPVAKAWTWYEAIPSGSNTVIYQTGGTIAGATAANANVTTASVEVGDAVIAGYFAEGVSAVTGDSDTTNGTWTAQQTATIGSTTSGVRIATQQKVQTTTASTQSYDATVASQDRIAGYVLLHELVATTITPGVASLTSTPFAPSVAATDNKTVTLGLLTAALTPFAPTVSATAHVMAVADAASLMVTTLTPAVTASDHQLVIPATTSVSTTALAPTVTATAHQTATAGTASLATTVFAPTISTTAHVQVTPATTSLSTTSFEPTVTATAHQVVTPGLAPLSTTTLDPTVTATAHQVVTPTTATVSLTTYAPSLTAISDTRATPDTAALSTSTFASTIDVTANQTITPGTASLGTTALVPTVAATAHKVIIPAPAGLTLTSRLPFVAVSDAQLVTPDTASLTLAAFAPFAGEQGAIEVVIGTAALELVAHSAVPVVRFGGIHGGISFVGTSASIVSTTRLIATASGRREVGASIRTIDRP